MGTVEDTLSAAEMVRVMIVMLGSEKRTACRDMSMATFASGSMCRSDDVRLLHIPDLLAPVLVRVIGEGAPLPAATRLHAPIGADRPARAAAPSGPSPCFLTSMVLRGGKRQVGGKVAYAGCIRNKQALLCAQGALARSFMADYTLDLRGFPDPRDREMWLRLSPIWLGGSGTESISYAQHHEVLSSYFDESDVLIRKVTHAWRMFMARDLDEQGVPDEVRLARAALSLDGWQQPYGCASQNTLPDARAPTRPRRVPARQLIARLGRWMRTALNQSYLRFYKPQGLLAACGWDKDHPDGFFAERFCIEVPDELVDFVFPFLGKLKEQASSPHARCGTACWLEPSAAAAAVFAALTLPPAAAAAAACCCRCLLLLVGAAAAGGGQAREPAVCERRAPGAAVPGGGARAGRVRDAEQQRPRHQGGSRGQPRPPAPADQQGVQVSQPCTCCN